MFPTHLLPSPHFFLDNSTPILLYYIPLTASTSPPYCVVTRNPSQCMVRSNDAERAFASHLERAQKTAEFPMRLRAVAGGPALSSFAALRRSRSRRSFVPSASIRPFAALRQFRRVRSVRVRRSHCAAFVPFVCSPAAAPLRSACVRLDALRLCCVRPSVPIASASVALPSVFAPLPSVRPSRALFHTARMHAVKMPKTLATPSVKNR